MSQTVIVIAGPTAVGKTHLAIQLAQHFQTGIISADSRQCYRELYIGVAKPTADQLAAAKHYFINSHSVHETVTAASFEEYALAAANNIFRDQPIAVMVGGTGLYIKAFCEGLDAIPPVPEEVRQAIVNRFEEEGIAFLQREVQAKDPAYWQKGEQHNPQRLMRALEVKLATGESILSFQNRKKEPRPFRIIKIALELPREVLYDRINLRVDEMIKQGLLEEVKRLLPYRHLNALQTVGYAELFDCFDGKTTLEKAVELIKQNTRRYAKRQMTWFKKDKDITWFAPGEYAAVVNYIESAIQKK